MTYLWRAELNVWPHATDRGGTVDRKEAGEPVQSIDVLADSIDEALKLAQCFQKGIVTNPMVWQAPIFKLERIEALL